MHPARGFIRIHNRDLKNPVDRNILVHHHSPALADSFIDIGSRHTWIARKEDDLHPAFIVGNDRKIIHIGELRAYAPDSLRLKTVGTQRDTPQILVGRKIDRGQLVEVKHQLIEIGMTAETDGLELIARAVDISESVARHRKH